MFVSNRDLNRLLEAIHTRKDISSTYFVNDLMKRLDKDEKRQAEREEERKRQALIFRREMYEQILDNEQMTATQLQYKMAKIYPMVSLPKIVGNLRAMYEDSKNFPGFQRVHLRGIVYFTVKEERG